MRCRFCGGTNVTETFPGVFNCACGAGWIRAHDDPEDRRRALAALASKRTWEPPTLRPGHREEIELQTPDGPVYVLDDDPRDRY